MTTHPRRIRRSLFAAPALLALLHTAHAQTEAPAGSPANSGSSPGTSSSTVVVNGTRGGAGDSHIVNPATNKILSGKRASSCGFIGAPKKGYDDTTVAYMRSFNLENDLSNDNDRFSDVAPGGDTSNTNVATAGEDFMPQPVADTPAGGCGPSDKRFAAGRNHIERKDKSVGEAYAAFDNGDYPRALQLFTSAYNKLGYDDLAVMLGRLYLFGLGTPKDTKQAIHWLREAATAPFDPAERLHFDPAQPQQMNGRIEAAFMLARIYQHGLGIAKDPAQARAWYAKATDFGFVPALDMLGEDWLTGPAASRNPANARDYLKQAADAGYVPAQYHLAKLYYVGEGNVARDLKQAGAYFEAAARRGHPGALFAAGRMFDLGEGVPADSRKAIVYYKDAALKGDCDAQFALGTFFYSGELVPKDATIARKWFDAAARQGQPDAMFNLGVMQANGEGGSKDAGLAYVWFTLAQEAGHQGAGAALKALAPKLTADERKRADTVLKPALAKAQ